MTNSERRVQRVRKALEPPGEARDDIVDHRRARPPARPRLGRPDRRRRSGTSCASLSPMHAGMSYARLEELGGIQWPCPDEDAPRLPVPARAALGRAARGPAGAVHRSSRHAAAVRGARRRLPDPAHDRPPARVVQHRARRRTSTARRCTAASRSTSRPRTPSGSSSPRARSSGSRPGAARSRRRSASTRRCGPGLAFMTFHFPDEVDTNQLTIDATDPKSGTAEFKAAAIRVEKLEPAARDGRRGVAEPAARRTGRRSGPPPRPRRRAHGRRERRARHRARPARDGLGRRRAARRAGGQHRQRRPRARARRHLLLPALWALQERIGWISPGGLNEVCRRLTAPARRRLRRRDVLRAARARAAAAAGRPRLRGHRVPLPRLRRADRRSSRSGSAARASCPTTARRPGTAARASASATARPRRSSATRAPSRASGRSPRRRRPPCSTCSRAASPAPRR